MSTSDTSTLRETEIRPDHLMAEQAQRFAADIRRLMEHRQEFVSVPCPACGSEQANAVFEKYGLQFVGCIVCSTMYINPRPSPAVLKDYYETSENYQYWNDVIFPASEAARREKIFRPRAERLSEISQRLGVGHRLLVEVGAGFGTFCEELQRLRLFEKIIAVEPTPDLAATCRRKGIDVIESPIEQVTLEPGSVDVVASFEVLEHLFSPRDFIRSCAALLKPGGLLVLTCPNGKGFDVVTLGALSGVVDNEHLNYFNPGSLSGLVESCGLEVLEVSTPGKLDAELVRKAAQAGDFDLSDHPFLKQILLDEWDQVGVAFQTFLAENALSSHMWFVARTPS